MQATEGNGGPGIVLARDPVERPSSIPRGEHRIVGHITPSEEGERVTYVRQVDDFDVTYHDIQVMSHYSGYIYVFVTPHDVVTWAKRG